MIDLDEEVCVCNSVTFRELIDIIQEESILTLEELLENSTCPVGDKCESCIDEGFNNDGHNLPLALKLAHQDDSILE